MAFTTTPNVTDYIDRGVLMLLANTQLRNTVTPGDSLVTNVLAQEPPIDQSPNTSIIPVIYVGQSKNPIREVENIGRDSLDEAGPKYYHLEFYNVCIVRGISRQNAQEKAQKLSEVVRDTYQKSLRMTKPLDNSDPLAATNTVISVPFVLKSSDPNIQAINVICRPNVPVSLL